MIKVGSALQSRRCRKVHLHPSLVKGLELTQQMHKIILSVSAYESVRVVVMNAGVVVFVL